MSVKCENCCIYARVSSLGERQSTERQVSDLRSFASSHDLAVVRVFQEHISGAAEDRPVLSECLHYLADNRDGCRCLLVSEVSRLGRSVKVVVNTIDDLTKAGVSVYIADIGMWTIYPDGTANPLAPVVLTIFSLGAQMERQAIVSRLNSGRARAIAQGVKLGRPKQSCLSDEEILTKYPKVAQKLKKGLSLRDAAKVGGVSLSTAQKVGRALKSKEQKKRD